MDGGIQIGRTSGAPSGESPLFMGMKQRRYYRTPPFFQPKSFYRRSSDVKPFVGDLFHMQDNQAFAKAMSKTGDKKVLFSDEILKVNRKFSSFSLT